MNTPAMSPRSETAAGGTADGGGVCVLVLLRLLQAKEGAAGKASTWLLQQLSERDEACRHRLAEEALLSPSSVSGSPSSDRQASKKQS